MSARELYKNFRGANPDRFERTGLRFGSRWITRPGKVNILVPASLMVVGHLSAVEYDTQREGRALLARHVFAPGSRPVLMAGSGPGQLFIVGDRFSMTERGIVDQDSRGRSIDFHENTGEIKRLR